MWNVTGCLVMVVLFTCTHLTDTKKDYTGSTVLRVIVQNDQQLRQFKELSKTFGYEVDEWGPTDIFVPNERKLKIVEARLKQHGFSYKVLVSDVGRLIDKVDKENQEHENVRRKRSPKNGQTWRLLSDNIVGKYPTFQEISNWLQEVDEKASPITEKFTLGQTYGYRDIYLLKIGKRSVFAKPAIWLDFGVHAREWISVSTGIYIIYHLLNGYYMWDYEIEYLLDNIDLYVAPLANPDGYVHTHEEDRLHRKNLGPDYFNTGCNGTDLNRNFLFHWGERRASCYQCDQQYRGPWAESELETRAISAALTALSDTLQVYMSVHSYGQMILTRWSYSPEEAEDIEMQREVARLAVQAIRNTTGSEYYAGAPADILYSYSGGAADFAKGILHIPRSYGVELRDTGNYGFLLPAQEINSTGAEFLAALKAVMKFVIEEAKNGTTFYQRQSHRRPVNLNNVLDTYTRDITSANHVLSGQTTEVVGQSSNAKVTSDGVLVNTAFPVEYSGALLVFTLAYSLFQFIV